MRYKQREDVEDADEEMGCDESKGRKELIPSLFANSRN
jgi:hypothetical protein